MIGMPYIFSIYDVIGVLYLVSFLKIRFKGSGIVKNQLCTARSTLIERAVAPERYQQLWR
ncbi:hypothetical protein ACM26V_04580 [Salipaludibacillus sp. HK11]|uniref:hypothetical protein n=1 Tax=Salipaludibacillus sp. HK11 TaxID=3394320 RepID=UPI0039FD450D